MRNKSKIAISIELHDDFIKVCELVTSGHKQVFNFIKKEFSSKEDKIISQEIAELFKTHAISKKNVFLNIPRHLVMSRILCLPSIDDREISDMVKIESEAKMPHLTEDVIACYKVIERLKGGYSDVLLVIAQKGMLLRLIDILKNANLSVEKIALSSESLFFWYCMVKEDSKKDKDFPLALLNLDPEYIDMEVIEKGRFVFTRAFSNPKKDPSMQRDVLDDIKRTIIVYQKEKNVSVEKVIITGAYSRFRDLEPILEKELEIPLEFVEQTKNIQVDKKVGMDIDETSFVELVGLSAKNEEFQINLLSEHMIEGGKPQFFKRGLFKTLILSVCLIFALFGLIAKRMYDKSQKLSYLDSQINAMASQVEEAERAREYLKIVKNELIKRPLAIDILAEVCKITPKGVGFSLLDYEINKFLLIKGKAPTLNEVVTFISILEESRYFENVRIRYTKNSATGDKNETDFELICSLSNLE